ncbi:hypothetical protein ANN_10980 [Periplaneta americana]|uniref:Uncharacterized protein n=1 Tax=Periplaneta americana TaxID=6978 RepID=A0ABQ8T3R3_PERAM|nr:hypothetical protein ANN_10980 [Periplaneta americana]
MYAIPVDQVGDFFARTVDACNTIHTKPDIFERMRQSMFWRSQSAESQVIGPYMNNCLPATILKQVQRCTAQCELLISLLWCEFVLSEVRVDARFTWGNIKHRGSRMKSSRSSDEYSGYNILEILYQITYEHLTAKRMGRVDRNAKFYRAFSRVNKRTALKRHCCGVSSSKVVRLRCRQGYKLCGVQLLVEKYDHNYIRHMGFHSIVLVMFHVIIDSYFRQNASCEVYEEVGCVSSDGSTRRADIIIDRQKDEGVILNPTIRFEINEQHPQEDCGIADLLVAARCLAGVVVSHSCSVALEAVAEQDECCGEVRPQLQREFSTSTSTR